MQCVFCFNRYFIYTVVPKITAGEPHIEHQHVFMTQRKKNKYIFVVRVIHTETRDIEFSIN